MSDVPQSVIIQKPLISQTDSTLSSPVSVPAVSLISVEKSATSVTQSDKVLSKPIAILAAVVTPTVVAEIPYTGAQNGVPVPITAVTMMTPAVTPSSTKVVSVEKPEVSIAQSESVSTKIAPLPVALNTTAPATPAVAMSLPIPPVSILQGQSVMPSILPPATPITAAAVVVPLVAAPLPLVAPTVVNPVTAAAVATAPSVAVPVIPAVVVPIVPVVVAPVVPVVVVPVAPAVVAPVVVAPVAPVVPVVVVPVVPVVVAPVATVVVAPVGPVVVAPVVPVVVAPVVPAVVVPVVPVVAPVVVAPVVPAVVVPVVSVVAPVVVAPVAPVVPVVVAPVVQAVVVPVVPAVSQPLSAATAVSPFAELTSSVKIQKTPPPPSGLSATKNDSVQLKSVPTKAVAVDKSISLTTKESSKTEISSDKEEEGMTDREERIQKKGEKVTVNGEEVKVDGVSKTKQETTKLSARGNMSVVMRSTTGRQADTVVLTKPTEDSKSPSKAYAPTTFGRIAVGGEKFGSSPKKPTLATAPVSKESTPATSPTKSVPVGSMPSTFGRVITPKKPEVPLKDIEIFTSSKDSQPCAPSVDGSIGSMPSTFGRTIINKKQESNDIISPFSPSKELGTLSPSKELGTLSPSKELGTFSPSKELRSLSPSKDLGTTVILKSTFGKVGTPKKIESTGTSSPTKRNNSFSPPKDSGSSTFGRVTSPKKSDSAAVKEVSHNPKNVNVVKDSGSMKELGTYYPPTGFGSMPTTFGTRIHEKETGTGTGTLSSPNKLNSNSVNEKNKEKITAISGMKNGIKLDMKSEIDDKASNEISNEVRNSYDNGVSNDNDILKTPERNQIADEIKIEGSSNTVKSIVSRQNSGLPSDVPSVGKYASDSEKIRKQNSASKCPTVNDSEKIRRQNSTSKYASDSEKIKRENNASKCAQENNKIVRQNSGTRSYGNDSDLSKKQNNGNNKYANVQSKLYSPTTASVFSRKEKVVNSHGNDTEIQTKRMLFTGKDDNKDDSSISPSLSTQSIKRRSSLSHSNPVENVRLSIKWKENNANFEDYYRKRGEFLTNYLHAICREPSKSLMKDTVNSSHRSVSMIDINLLKEKKEIRRLSILANKEKYLHQEEKRFQQQAAIHSDNWNSSNLVSKRRSSLLGKGDPSNKSPLRGGQKERSSTSPMRNQANSAKEGAKVSEEDSSPKSCLGALFASD